MNKTQDNITLLALPKEKLVPLIKDTLLSGSPFILTVTGYSMRPTLSSKGDKVELLNPTIRPVKKGEMVFFERENGDCVLHRVIKMNDDNTVTVNGDAQLWTETVDVSSVIGVVNRFCRSEKWISCDSVLYRVYSSIWLLLKPARRVIIKIKRLISNR